MWALSCLAPLEGNPNLQRLTRQSEPNPHLAYIQADGGAYVASSVPQCVLSTLSARLMFKHAISSARRPTFCACTGTTMKAEPTEAGMA